MSMRIRDAVHGDVLINEWEEHCIRRPTFQRLHRIKQLGNSYHVYPSAMHTRFEHSLGVCYQVQKLLAQPNFFDTVKVPNQGKKKLIRLVGLIHDIVHTPFKHTLDRDAAIIPKDNLADEYAHRIDELALDKILPGDEIKLIHTILSAEDAYNLPEPYLKHIIEDTLSADLLDYTLRDAYFTTGIVRKWDQRIYNHIAVYPFNGKPCLVARITGEEGETTESAITELSNLLDIRYLLNERVYFYPTKIAADSLLVKNIRSFLMKKDMEPRKFKAILKDMSDDELIRYLIENDPRTGFYAEHLKNRILPKIAHSFKSDDFTDYQRKEIESTCRGEKRGAECFPDWEDREQRIAKEAGVDTQRIIIYCHDPKMQKKKPDILIKDIDKEPRPLSSHDRMKRETEAIAKKHGDLWRCYVFYLEEAGEFVKVKEKVKNAAVEVLGSLDCPRILA